MPHDLAYERNDVCFFCTTRTINSRLWFVKNPEFDERVLAYLAKYQEMFGVIIYAFIIMGNHYHLLAMFPRGNKAAFFQALNGIIAKLAARYIKGFKEGKLWARRVRCQAVPNNEDILKQFLYTALNPVNSGIVKSLRDYRSYNSVHDAIDGRARKFEVVDWHEFNNRKRYNNALQPKDFAKTYNLEYTKLPGFAQREQAGYASHLTGLVEAERNRIVEERNRSGKGFMTRHAYISLPVGSEPRTSKKALRQTPRPLVITLCVKTKRAFLEWYFSLLNAYRQASKKFRLGANDVFFPPGTYLPHRFSS